MSKYSVKKPFTVLVGVVMLIVLGIVSFTKLTTDLLPTISLPYVVVITSYPGASPEKVEADVTQVLESSLGTVNGVENVRSNSNENYSMVMLEFAEETNMDSAMVKLSTAIDQLTFPEMVGTPMLMEISPDLMATMYLAVDYEGMDIYELTEFAKENVIPYLERQPGVASVDATGLVEKSVEIKLDQKKIDKINDQVLGIATDKLADAQAELDDAKRDLKKAKSELKNGENELKEQQETTTQELAETSKMLDEAMATKVSYSAQLVGIKAEETALSTEKEAYEKNKVKENYEQINAGFETARKTLASQETHDAIYNAIFAQAKIAAVQGALAQAGMVDMTVDAENVDTYLTMLGEDASKAILEGVAKAAEEETGKQIEAQLATIPTDVKDALDNPDKLKAFRKSLKDQGQEKVAEGLTKKNLQTLYDIVEVRIPQVDAELANLAIEVKTAEAVSKKVEESIKEAEDGYLKLEAGKISAAAGFGAASAQIASGLSQIESGEKQLESAQDQIDESRENVMKSANMDALLNMATIAQLISAQNFDMPAGYIQNEDDTEILVKVGDEFDEISQIEDMILCNIDKIGDVRISDVASVEVTDNAEDSHASLNKNVAVILSISKASTSGTSEVSKTCNKALEELEEKYSGLHLTPLMDQGDYIKMIINSVLSNLIWGALLAIIVLAIFLKDFRPTVVVAFSIPMSVLFAIVLMYFTNITMNILSLSGLALGVGMLVDNSIVVIENIYRLRSKGVPAARAAVMGANQVAGAIAASTLTTICVFLPIVFTTGLTRELFTDMALTIAYSLIASLVVALTVVPSMSATVLKNSSEKSHALFDKVMVGYGKVLSFCLNIKILPLVIAIGLLVMCVIRAFATGMIMLPEMGGNQMSMNISVSDDMTAQEGYELGDAIMEDVMNMEGVQTVGVMSGGGSGGNILMSGGSNKDLTYYIILSDPTGKDNPIIAKKLEKLLEEKCPEGCEYSVATSNMDMSALMGSGLSMKVYGEDVDEMLAASNDMVDLLESIDGFDEVSNGQEEADKQLLVTVDKDKSMRLGLTVAQVYAELSGALTTTKDSTTLAASDHNYQVTIIDETDMVTEKNLLDYEFTTNSTDDDGKQVEETHRLSEFAKVTEGESIARISRENQERYITVSAVTKEGYNTTLLSREVEDKLAKYNAKDGIRIEIEGESEQVMKMMHDMLLMILLAVIFIYLVMVAQFQSLLSPFIVLFTIPLAFTGGFLGLMFTGEDLSMIAMMGFLILAGVVVNNGIVFVDYANQLRLDGMERREALIETGKTRMRPILMTAMTTILAMMTMALSRDASAVMSKGMAIVTIGGLAYATLMTLFIVPVMYDILFKKELKKVDLGDEENLLEE